MSSPGSSSGDHQVLLDPRLVPHKSPRLAVSGPVNLSQLEVGIIDTPEFQRLRRLRQLSLAIPGLSIRHAHALRALPRSPQVVSPPNGKHQRESIQ